MGSIFSENSCKTILLFLFIYFLKSATAKKTKNNIFNAEITDSKQT